MMALVVQKTGQRQGNPCPALYRWAAPSTRHGGPAVFHDITQGDSCVPGTQGYSCRPGYDLATGLGSVDGAALVGAWTGGRGDNVDARILDPDADLTVPSGTAVAFRGSAGTGDPGRDLRLGLRRRRHRRGPGLRPPVPQPGPVPPGQPGHPHGPGRRRRPGHGHPDPHRAAPPRLGELIQDGGFELGSRAWTGHGVSVGDNSAHVPAHQGRGCAWFPGDRDQDGVLQQTVNFPPRAGSARLTFWLRVDTREPGGLPLDTFQVKARGAGGKLAILGTWTNLDQGAGYLPCAVNLGAYLGQKVQLSFVASSYRYGRTTDFALDDASLVAH